MAGIKRSEQSCIRYLPQTAHLPRKKSKDPDSLRSQRGRHSTSVQQVVSWHEETSFTVDSRFNAMRRSARARRQQLSIDWDKLYPIRHWNSFDEAGVSIFVSLDLADAAFSPPAQGGAGERRPAVPKMADGRSDGAVVVLVLAGLKLLGPTAATPIDPETKTVSVIVPDVDNRSGDPAFDGVLEQLLSISLGSAEPHDLSKDVVL